MNIFCTKYLTNFPKPNKFSIWSNFTQFLTTLLKGSPRSGGIAQQQAGALNSENYNEGETGVVTVIDLADLISVETGDTGAVDIMTTKMEAVVAHFVAHTKAIVALQWDHSGSLLLTADKPGHNFHLFRYLTHFLKTDYIRSNFTIQHFNLFRIAAHPLGSAFAAVHHLYTLYRGDTPGSVQDVAFSPDSRWVAYPYN